MKALCASAVCMVITFTNVRIFASIVGTLDCFFSCFPPDLIAGIIYVTAGLLMMLAIDAQALITMFLPFASSPEQALKSPMGNLVGFMNKAFVALNWMAGNGVACAAMKVTMLNKVRNYSFQSPTPQLMGGIVSGDVDLIPFTRAGSERFWESMYGQVCALYLLTVFALLVARKSGWGRTMLVVSGACLFGCFAGYFAFGAWIKTTGVLFGWFALLCVLNQPRFFGAPDGGPAGGFFAWADASKRRLSRSLSRRPSLISCSCDDADAMKILLGFNITLSVWLAVIYYLGKNNIWSSVAIYVPPCLALLGTLREGHWVMSISLLISIVHGFAHKIYPFLDEHEGVVMSVDAWQDQGVHSLQAVLYMYMWWDKGRTVKICLVLFTISCYINVFFCWACWGQACHDAFVWWSLSAATASGIHVAIGAAYGQSKGVQWSAHLLQGASAIITYFIFKGSDEILYFFAKVRFFELYFIAGHMHGFANYQLSNVESATKLFAGAGLMLVAGPYMVLQTVLSKLWEVADKGTLNIVDAIRSMSERLSAHTSGFTRNDKDGFMVPVFLWNGLVLPAWFFYELYAAATFGLQWQRVVLYNVVRVGPMYMNFGNVTMLCHKEAHQYGKLFRLACYPFNHWVGLFHGVLPGTFTYAHMYNHHKYDNDYLDITSTVLRPRDRIGSFLRYLPQWFGYASNISTISTFAREGHKIWAFGVFLSTLWYVMFLGACWYIHPLFTTLTLIFAFVETNVLLSMANWVWHAFIDEDDPSNDFVNRTTVIEGLHFAGKEEYHATHHQYPSAHWSRHEELFVKHLSEYRKCVASAFYKVSIYELFMLMVTQQYGKLADRYYKPFIPDGMTRDELADLIRCRLQAHGPFLACQVGRKNRAKKLEKDIYLATSLEGNDDSDDSDNDSDSGLTSDSEEDEKKPALASCDLAEQVPKKLK